MNLDIQTIENIVKTVAKSGVHEVVLSDGTTTLTIVGGSQAPSNISASTPLPAVETHRDNAENTIISQSVGKFIADIDGKSALKIGDVVNVGDVVAAVLALGVLSPIVSDKAGVIGDVLINDGENVEYGQEVFRLS